MSNSEPNKTKLFTQVARTTKVEQDMLDPLSMFAMQEAQEKEEPREPVPPPKSSAALNVGASALSLKTDLKVPTVTPATKKSESRSSLRSNSPTPATAAASNAAAPSALAPAPAPPTPSAKSAAPSQLAATADDEILLKSLTGEQKIMSILDSFMTIATGELISGTLFMTNYRLVFIPSSSDLTTVSITNPSIHSYLQVPIAAIDKIDREKRGKDAYNSAISVVIHCKDFRQLRITIRSNTSKPGSGDYDIERAISVIAAYAFPNNMRYLFAFTHKLGGVQPCDVAEPYDPALEFSRLGVLDNPVWRVSTANATYKLCNTYPQWLVVPASMTDDDLHVVAGFRSGHRLPAMCWADRESGASMWRSSQPKAGVSGTCSQDERMLDLIAKSCISMSRRRNDHKKYSQEGTLCIVDCRSRASAMANRAAGAGYESQTNYPSSRLEFYSISNIHAVRDMYKNLGAFLLAAAPGSAVDLNFTKQFEDTQWLNSIRSILKAAHDTATFLHNGAPVLVHCSHGWDRTAQVCALAQLMLDPYYRTFDGFRVLVEKEWVSFGHAFQMRCAHSQDKATRAEDQVSQVMIQFLDCVWQIHHQCMQYFEFNARYILVIADHVYSGRFGTFLFSSDYERDLYNARQACPDIWTYLNCNRAVLGNPLYTNPERVMLPPASQLLRNVTIWADYFLRWSSVPTVAPIPLQLSQHLYADGLCRALHEDELHEETVVPVDAQGVPLSFYADFEISAAITSADCWEAAYRAERMKRINVEAQKQKTIDQLQMSVERLKRLLSTHAPDLAEEDIAAALHAQGASPRSGSAVEGASPATELDTGMATILPPKRSSFSAPHVDPLMGLDARSGDHGGSGVVISKGIHLPSPAVTASPSMEEMRSATPPVDTPTAADDASFYPEDGLDEEGGVSV